MTDKLIATLNKAGVRNISTDLWGIFYEDISYSGDGGLNADLVQNGAFEYNRADSSDWSNYSFWRRFAHTRHYYRCWCGRLLSFRFHQCF